MGLDATTPKKEKTLYFICFLYQKTTFRTHFKIFLIPKLKNSQMPLLFFQYLTALYASMYPRFALLKRVQVCGLLQQPTHHKILNTKRSYDADREFEFWVRSLFEPTH